MQWPYGQRIKMCLIKLRSITITALEVSEYHANWTLSWIYFVVLTVLKAGGVVGIWAQCSSTFRSYFNTGNKM